MPEILLLTTSTGKPDRLADLARLVGSLAVAETRLRAAHPDWTVRHIVLLQNGTVFHGDRPGWCDIVTHPGPLSLSAARNRLFGLAGAERLAAAAAVGFPDDDAWYTPDWLCCLARQFGTAAPPDLLVTRYGTTPDPRPLAAPVQDLTPGLITYWTASPSMFVSGPAALAGGRFDERLSVGPGAIWNGGEDTDFALRVWQPGPDGRRRGVLVDAACIGHRDRTPGMSLNYIVGNTFVLARHVKRHPSLWPKLAKKWLVFFYAALRGRLPWARFRPFVEAQRVALAGVEVL